MKKIRVLYQDGYGKFELHTDDGIGQYKCECGCKVFSESGKDYVCNACGKKVTLHKEDK